MLYLEDFLELIEQLPGELRDRGTEMRMLDLQVQRVLDQVNKSVKEFFEQAPSLSKEEQNRRYAKIKEEYKRIREMSDEKTSIAEAMYTLLEKYSQKLNKELLHFKYELEADNPGITEQIEKKFLDTERTVLAQRKERKKRLHDVSQSSSSAITINGGGLGVKLETCTPTPSRASAQRTSGSGSTAGEPMHLDLNPSAHNSRSSFAAHDDDLMGPSSSSTLIRGGSSRALAGVVDRDPDLPPLKVTVKRALGNPNKLIAITNVSSSPTLSSLSPSCSEKGDRWMPSSTSLTPPVHSPSAGNLKSHQTPGGKLGGAGGSSSNLTAALASGSSMLTFAGQESRHGRPRKLTSRVQEMLKDTMQRHERRLPSHHSEHEEASDGDDSDHDNDKRTWCICNQKSYGDMVACDNKSCPFEWFHYECVNLTQPPKGKWFCPHCLEAKQRRSVSLEGV